jgi:nicotinate-nucleotide--dimethylbenzimidazole phosphoribosyltransferase
LERVPGAILEALAAVEPPDAAWHARAAARQERLTMPPGSLGRLLEVGRQLAAIQRTDRPVAAPALVAVFAADHGVAAAGVSAYPSEVTGQMVANYLRGGAAVNVLARRVGAAVRVVDLGVAHPPQDLGSHEALHAHPIRPGTANFLLEPAMTRAEAFEAFQVGLELAEQWTRREGFHVVALGEMGIGNTTTASTLVAALTGAPVDRVVGRGTGISDVVYRRKCQVVASALERHGRAVGDPWDWLARVGGFEILGLAGLAVGAARHRALVVLDGLISGTAGLIAAQLCPNLSGSLLAAHRSPEPGHRVVLDALGLTPLLELGLRLGEGTGAALALPLVAAAADLLRDMATFDEAGVAGPSNTTQVEIPSLRKTEGGRPKPRSGAGAAPSQQ